MLSKPEAFQKQHVAFRHIPYVCDEAANDRSSHTGGVIGRGETVWTTETFETGHCPASAKVFVESVGVISLDPRWLVRADALADGAETH